MTDTFASPRTRSAEKSFVISWLHQTNDGEVRKPLDNSFQRIQSQDYLQSSLKRKIKPTLTSDSSIIERPVRTCLKCDIEDIEKNKLTEKPKNELYLEKSMPKSYDSIRDEDSYLSAPFPETVFKKRMRHKTREDRYEINKKKKIKHKSVAKTSGKSRRNRRKSKKSIHEKPLPCFSSRKIGTDRLTLRTSNNRGIFKNGRASSPITRRGVPDLSFSEMEFLQHSRKVPLKDNECPTEKKGRLNAKCRNLENDEISTFFKPPTKSLRSNNDQYYLKSSDGLIRKAKSTNENPGLPIIDERKPFLNPRASIGSFSNLSTQSSSARSCRSIENCSSSIAKSYFPFSETKNSSHNQVFDLIRDVHNDSHLMDIYTGSRSITPAYIKVKNKDKYKKQSSVEQIENSEEINVINASLENQSTDSNSRMTSIDHRCSDAKNNLNAHVNLKGEKEDKIIENNMKHVGTMTTCHLDQQMNIEQKRENFLSQDKCFLTKTQESTEISDVLKIPTKSVHIKRPSTAIPILRASLERNFPAQEIFNLRKQTNVKTGSLLFHEVHSKDNTSCKLSNPLAINCCTPKKEQRYVISINNDDQLSLFGVSEQNLDKITICEPPKNQIEENLSSKKTSTDRLYSNATPKSSINCQNDFFDNIYYHSIASPNLIAEADSLPPVELAKEQNYEEKYQFLSQLQHYQNSNDHVPNHAFNSSPIIMGYTYPSPLAEDTQYIGTDDSFYNACDQQDDQSEFMNQTLHYNNDFANLDELKSTNIELKKYENESFQNKTIIGLSQLDNHEAYTKTPIITDRKPYMTSKPQDFNYLFDTSRFMEEQLDMEGFWDIHRGY